MEGVIEILMRGRERKSPVTVSDRAMSGSRSCHGVATIPRPASHFQSRHAATATIKDCGVVAGLCRQK